ncbi:MAG: type II toxin-antitoxin system RelE/ParE family toxin [Spirochaetia bacterium]|nr:type II toxin-antitoxin system RelE/ParE family toxin [Spirochaetia bacterium]
MELTNIHYSSYNETKWDIYSSEEYEAWFETLDSESKEAVLERVLLLETFGPSLPRPYADVIKGSRYKNLKELRAQTLNHILRIAYYFDHRRNAFLLTGGDKKGKNEGRFYKDLIAEAEIIIEKHEKEIKK